MRSGPLKGMRWVCAVGCIFALSCAHTATKQDRNAAEIHHDLALEALQAGRTQEAMHEYEEALKLNPDFAEAHLGKGLVLEFGYERVVPAEQSYRRAISLKPNYSEAYNDLGQLLAKEGHYTEAIGAFDQALSNLYYKEPFVARCNRGEAIYRSGQKERGVLELRACVAQARNYCAGHRQLGQVLLDEGRVRDALESLQRYAKVCEKVPDAYLQLGLAQVRNGAADEARKAFRHCQELATGTDLGDLCQKREEQLR